MRRMSPSCSRRFSMACRRYACLPAGAWRPRLPRGLSAWLGLPWRARWRWLGRKVGELLRGGNRIDSPDRVILERRAARRSPPTRRCARFSSSAASATRATTRRCSRPTTALPDLDIDPRRARFGHPATSSRRCRTSRSTSPRRASTRRLQRRLRLRHLRPRRARQGAARSCTVLRPGGTFVLGWNDVAAFAPFDPLESRSPPASFAIRRAARRWRVGTDTPTRHTFDTYRRALLRSPWRASITSRLSPPLFAVPEHGRGAAVACSMPMRQRRARLASLDVAQQLGDEVEEDADARCAADSAGTAVAEGHPGLPLQEHRHRRPACRRRVSSGG